MQKDDVIYRQAVLDLINADWKYEGLEIEINNLPSAQSEQHELITWLLDEIWDDDVWELNYAAFPEILCRKLVKLGYVAVDGDKYVRIDKPTEHTETHSCDYERTGGFP